MKAKFKAWYLWGMRLLRVMERRCMQCQKVLGWKRCIPEMAGKTTHGICRKCQVRWEAAGFTEQEQEPPKPPVVGAIEKAKAKRRRRWERAVCNPQANAPHRAPCGKCGWCERGERRQEVRAA